MVRIVPLRRTETGIEGEAAGEYIAPVEVAAPTHMHRAGQVIGLALVRLAFVVVARRKLAKRAALDRVAVIVVDDLGPDAARKWPALQIGRQHPQPVRREHDVVIQPGH